MPSKISIPNDDAKDSKEPIPVLNSINNMLKYHVNLRGSHSSTVDPLLVHLINSGVWKQLPELKTLILEFDPDDVDAYIVDELIKEHHLTIEVLYSVKDRTYQKKIWEAGKAILAEHWTDNLKIDMEYDSMGRLIKKTAGPLNEVVDDVNNENEVKVTTYHYLENGDKVETYIVYGVVNRISTSNKEGKILRYEYPEDGFSETFTYNENGDQLALITTEIIDGAPRIKTQKAEYNAAGDITKFELIGDEDIGHSVRIGYVYDEEGNLIRIED